MKPGEEAFGRQDTVADQWGGNCGGTVEEGGIDLAFAGIQQSADRVCGQREIHRQQGQGGKADARFAAGQGQALNRGNTAAHAGKRTGADRGGKQVDVGNG